MCKWKRIEKGVYAKTNKTEQIFGGNRKQNEEEKKKKNTQKQKEKEIRRRQASNQQNRMNERTNKCWVRKTINKTNIKKSALSKNFCTATGNMFAIEIVTLSSAWKIHFNQNTNDTSHWTK